RRRRRRRRQRGCHWLTRLRDGRQRERELRPGGSGLLVGQGRVREALVLGGHFAGAQVIVDLGEGLVQLGVVGRNDQCRFEVRQRVSPLAHSGEGAAAGVAEIRVVGRACQSHVRQVQSAGQVRLASLENHTGKIIGNRRRSRVELLSPLPVNPSL